MKFHSINKQLLYLFSCNLTILLVGMGLFPVLPLYATTLGATPSLVGIYLALTYASITFGAMAAGWLIVRLPQRTILSTAGGLGVPSLVLMGQVSALWQLVVLTGIVWFTGGVVLSVVSVLTGLVADRTKRGKSFSLMSMGTPLGALIGGTIVSQLIALKGYALMFAALGSTWLLIPLLASQLAEQVHTSQKTARAVSPKVRQPLARPFYLFIPVFLLSTIAVSVGRLGTSLSMQALVFSPSEVASTATVSGLAAIPVVLLIGRLSDRMDRRHLLVSTYALAAAGVLLLTSATQLWHFWLAATLLLITRCVNGAVGSAYVTDILAPQELAKGLSWLNTTGWVAGVLTFAGAGHLIGQLGPSPVYMLAGICAVAATALLEWLGGDYRPKQAMQAIVKDIKRITQNCLAVVRPDERGTG
jgi:MFS family permease